MHKSLRVGAVARADGVSAVLFAYPQDEVPTDILPRMLLDDLLKRSDDVPPRIVAYAIESKKDEDPPLPGRIQAAYTTAKLRQDLSAPPAAA